MIVRFSVAIAVGASITFGLLFLMQILIATGHGAITKRHESVKITDFVRAQKPKVVQTRQQEAQKPPDAQQQPKLPKSASNAGGSSIGVSVSMSAPTISTNVDVGGVNIGVADGEYLPIVKVAPVYPARAAARGLEGYVIVEYTVTKTGTTKDVHVVKSTSSLFDRAAIESARKYKYKPRVVNGEPVEVPGVRTKITFVLKK
jgi:protein TonB